PAGVLRVELLALLAGQLAEAGFDDAKPAVLDVRENAADEISRDGVGLDDEQRALQRHVALLPVTGPTRARMRGRTTNGVLARAPSAGAGAGARLGVYSRGGAALPPAAG